MPRKRKQDEQEEEEREAPPKVRKTASSKKRKRDEDFVPDREELEEAEAIEPPEKKKRKPSTRKKAAPRMRRETKANRGRDNMLERIVGLDPRNDVDFITSWDIGETYMAAIRFDVRAQRMTHAATVNLKWGRERDTIRCETDTLNKFINDHPEICDTPVWALEEQFDDSESLRGSLEKVVAGSDLAGESKKKSMLRLEVPAKPWERLEQAVAEGVFKGPAMPVLETSVRTQALARGKEVISILPRHVMKYYRLPCSGHDKNKELSQFFVEPILTDEEKRIVEAANRLRDQQNEEHGGRGQNRIHDMHEAWLQAMFVASAWHEKDYIAEREPRDELGTPNRGGFVID